MCNDSWQFHINEMHQEYQEIHLPENRSRLYDSCLYMAVYCSIIDPFVNIKCFDKIKGRLADFFEPANFLNS